MVHTGIGRITPTWGRGFPVYAVVRELCRQGIAAIVDRGRDMASRIARRLIDHPGVRILNEVVLREENADRSVDAILRRLREARAERQVG